MQRCQLIGWAVPNVDTRAGVQKQNRHIDVSTRRGPVKGTSNNTVQLVQIFARCDQFGHSVNIAPPGFLVQITR